jgi:hypothetical protein
MKLLGALAIPVAVLAGCWPAPTRAEDSPAASLAAVLDECGAMGLAAQGLHVKDKTVKLGHLELGFADGTVVPVLGKSGSVLGVYFEGHGGYLYATDDVADREAMKINVSRIANALRPVAGKVSDDFKSALVLFSEPQFAELYARTEGSEAAPAEALVSGFRSTLAGALSTYGEFDFRTAQARLNGRGRWVYVELSGGLEHVGYVYDDVLDGYERLFGFRKLVDYNVRFSQTLSYQLIPGWDRTRRLAVVLKHADIALATEDNKSGTIDSDVTLRVHAPGTRLVTLSLLNNRDPDSADWSSPRQKLTLKHLLDADGKEVPFSHKYGEVAIEIPPTPAADTDVRLRFETEGEVFVDMGGRHTDNYFSMQGDAWYPSPAGWAGEQFTYTVKVKVKKPWRPVTSGKETMLKDDGDFRIAESRSDHPSMQIAVMAGKYFTRAETIDGFTVRVHSYAWNRKDVLDNMPKLAATFVKLYGGMLGPIPADELDIVEVPSYGWGISPSGMVLITSEAYTNVAAKFASGVNGRLAHEIAHQWFGHKAIPVDANDNWLAESFAEYFAGIAMGVVAAKEKSIHGFDEMLIEWRSESRNCETGGTIATANYLGGEHGPEDRYCLLYNRGPLVLHMLRTSIGNDRFFAATKKFLDAANDGPASTDDYAKAVSDTVQMDMRWYFDQWVRRSGNAQVDVEQHVDAASGGQFRLWGTIAQAPGDGFKKLLVPLVWDNGGKPEARVVFADQPEKKFEFLLPTKPGTIKPDPFQNNLAVYK